eukprot:Skav221114  [mRNA]  locus=scaffold233:148331:150309:+ [translate_table: standard]
MLRCYATHQALVLGAFQESRRQAIVLFILPTCKQLRQGRTSCLRLSQQLGCRCLLPFRGAVPSSINGLTVGGGCQGHVLLSLQPALDFEAANASINQGWYVVQSHEILWGQQVAHRIA